MNNIKKELKNVKLLVSLIPESGLNKILLNEIIIEIDRQIKFKFGKIIKNMEIKKLELLKKDLEDNLNNA